MEEASPSAVKAAAEAERAPPASSSKELDAALTQWARDLSQYANPDWKTERQHFDDGVEDVLLRLEEFEHLLEMCQKDAATCLFTQMPKLEAKFMEMQKTFDSVDRLEYMVARIKEDMDALDRQLTEAEATVSGGTTAGLKTFLPMIFGHHHKASPSSGAESMEAASGNFHRLRTFATDDFFPPQPPKDKAEAAQSS